MAKIQNISEIHPTLGFTEFDILEKYRKSFKEIADLTNVSINTALGRMRYAILNLRKLVEEHDIVLTL